MVNTFLVSSDFRTSAKILDNKRLNSQKKEAYQILNCCLDLNFLAKYFSCPIDFTNLREWIKAIAAAYKKLNYQFVVPSRLLPDSKGKMHQVYIPVEKPPAGTKLKDILDTQSFKLKYHGHLGTEIVNYEFLNIPKKVYEPDIVASNSSYSYCRAMSLGHVYHPIIRMWLGYEIALAEYVNVHIDEWIFRGFNNKMYKYIIPKEVVIVYPPWVNFSDLHFCHKASLNRKDSEFYKNFKEYLEVWYQHYPGQRDGKFEYWWPA